MKLQTSRRNYFKKHPVLNKTVLWRELHTGKQQHSPHMALLFLLAAFTSSPGPVFYKMAKNTPFVLWRRMSAVDGESLCLGCPWTSLAGVLIKSLLAIPWRRLARVFLCHIPLPVSRSFSLPPRGLWTSLSLQSHIKALIEASSFLFSRWSAGYVCACVHKTEKVKPQLYIASAYNESLLSSQWNSWEAVSACYTLFSVKTLNIYMYFYETFEETWFGTGWGITLQNIKCDGFENTSVISD